MKKYFVDEIIIFNDGEIMRGFYLTTDGKTALLEVPSDIYGDNSNLYEEEITLNQEIFTAKYEDDNSVHIKDGELLGELV